MQLKNFKNIHNIKFELDRKQPSKFRKMIHKANIISTSINRANGGRPQTSKNIKSKGALE